ncbi:recombination-associated protein RdgC [Rhizobacter sp. J219]|uniref:recombination-associated protein RdgC n=1 Tax=Rhizobacter sp. J219 TaxID=2898430 RepID=UPI002151027E|nr:recombination-associated protein RdgC [Rhizobacter sp. J219]
MASSSLKLCVERKAVPSQVIKSQLEAGADKIEAHTGRRPKGKKAKELKEDIVHGLLPRAFPKRSTTTVWIDPRAQLVVVGAGSTKAADRVVSLLVELLANDKKSGITLTLLQTEMSPAIAMSDWLKTREAPAGFSIDRECELKQPDSEKATVRYARHTLDIEEVGEHIAQGKLPTSLAMTWNGRVSFVLTEALALKKIKLLDVALEGAGATGQGDDNGFDTDVAITTGELSQLIPQLIDALGGGSSATSRCRRPPDQPLWMNSRTRWRVPGSSSNAPCSWAVLTGPGAACTCVLGSAAPYASKNFCMPRIGVLRPPRTLRSPGTAANAGRRRSCRRPVRHGR